MSAGTLLALYAAMAFGAALVVTQRGLKFMPSLAGARISVPFTMLLLWLAAPAFFDSRVLGSPALALFAAVGLLFPVAATLLAFEANRRMGPTVAGTVSSIAPLLAIGAGVLFLGEPLTVRLVVSALAVVAGIVLLSANHGGARSWPAAVLLLPLTSAVLRTVAQTVTKMGLQIVPSPFTAALVGYSVSAATLGLFSWALRARRRSREKPVALLAEPAKPLWKSRGVPWFLAAGTLNGSGVLTLYMALAREPLTVVAPIVAGYPVFTIMFSLGLLPTERLGIRRLAGAFLVVGGMVLVLV